LHSGGEEEKVLCSSGIYNGVSEASSVKSKGPNIGYPTRETTEEIQAGRRLTKKKKEEELSVNPSKKIHAKKIHF